MYIYIYTHRYIYIYIYTCIHKYIYIYIYTCILRERERERERERQTHTNAHTYKAFEEALHERFDVGTRSFGTPRGSLGARVRPNDRLTLRQTSRQWSNWGAMERPRPARPAPRRPRTPSNSIVIVIVMVGSNSSGRRPVQDERAACN